jgi:peptidoglycan biosynthesis protein MviN/MurJ (putative lipid II flippase)
MAVAAGTAEAIVMPALHRAAEGAERASIGGRLARFAIQWTLPGSVIVGCAAWALRPGASPQVVCLLLPIPVLGALSAVQISIQNAEDHLHSAVLSPIYGALLGGAVLWALPKNAVGLAGALVLFELGRTIGLWLGMGAPHGLQSAITKVRSANEAIAWALRRTMPQATAVLLASLGPMVDIFFASRLDHGAITTTEYANRLWNAVPLLFSGVLIDRYSAWSREAAVGSAFQSDVVKATKTVFWMAIGATLLSMAAVWPVIDLVYGFGSLDESGKRRLSLQICMYLLGVPFFVPGIMFARALNAIGAVRALTSAALLGCVLNVMLDWGLSALFGLPGIGLATSITYLVVMLALRAEWSHLSRHGGAKRTHFR